MKGIEPTVRQIVSQVDSSTKQAFGVGLVGDKALEAATDCVWIFRVHRNNLEEQLKEFRECN